MSRFDIVDILGLGLVVWGLFELRRLIALRSENAPFDKRLERAFRNGSIGSGHQFDELIREQFTRDEAHRTKLWEEAASNPRAARRLQRAIQQELEAVDGIIRYNADHRPEDKAGLQDLALLRKETEQELERAAALIRQLHE